MVKKQVGLILGNNKNCMKMSLGYPPFRLPIKLYPLYMAEDSSLHNIIFNSFRLVLVLWRLLPKLSFSPHTKLQFVRHSCFKKVLVEMECSHSMGGVNLLALLHQNHHNKIVCWQTCVRDEDTMC